MAWSWQAAAEKERWPTTWDVFRRSSPQGVGDGDGGGRVWEKGKEGLRGIKEGSEVWGLLLIQAWQGDVPLKRGRREGMCGRRGRTEQEALGTLGQGLENRSWAAQS